MGSSLASYAIRLVDSESKLLSALTVPLLMWAAPDSEEEGGPDRIYQTKALGSETRPRAGEPLIFELRKGTQKMNAFAMGITVGRNDNNDVILDDASISRFHAYFQQDLRTGGWKLVDAESRNGTWLGAVKLSPSQGVALGPSALVRFGDLTLRYFQPTEFVAYVRGLVESG